MFCNNVRQFFCCKPETNRTIAEKAARETELATLTESDVNQSAVEIAHFFGDPATAMDATVEDVRETEVAALIESHVNQDSANSTQDVNCEIVATKTAEPLEETDNWKISIRRHYNVLVERMSTDFGLLNELHENSSISYEEMQKIKASRTVHKRNRRLLDIVVNRNKHHELTDALKKSGQKHLVNYLEADGNYDEKFHNEWPLTKAEILIIDSNFGKLGDLLDICDLLGRLYSTGVVNKRQRDFINSKPTPYEKNEALLDILRRCSLNAYRQTIRCLHASNQSHIAEILENGGVLLRIDTKVQGVGIDVNQEEEEIVAGITNQLRHKTLPERSRILELLQLNLVDARQGHSVSLYFACHQLNDIDRLQQMTKDGRLKETIETVFNRLIKKFAKIRVQLKRITPDFKKSHKYFEDIAKQPKSDKTIRDIPLPTMSNLPFELLDSILRKSFLEHVLRENQVLKNKDYEAISQLASVDCCWFQRIRKRKFKKDMWRSLTEFYRRKDKLSSIYRINRQYLEENIRLKGLVNRLKANDCLRDVQTASLYRQNLPLGKKENFKRFRDLISEVVKKKEAIHSVFRRCLYDTKQNLVWEVIKEGGAMTRVEIKFHTVKTRHQNLQMVERINEIRDKTKIPRSHQIEELMGKLKQDDLEILNASKDGDIIVVWIWCKKKYALEKLQTMNKSKHIRDIFTELVKNLSFSSEERNPATIITKVNIDSEQFEKTIVVFFSIVAKFTSRLDFERKEEYVQGVTKLRNKIHVLIRRSSSPRCVIFVFEDEIPFRLQKRIEIKEIKNPIDIVSIEMENSLYVLDYRRCVWKIKEEEDEEEEKEKIIKWLELGDYSIDWQSTLSVTRDGQLLLVGRRKGDRLWSLWIFGGSEKGDLRFSIPLPEDIQRPRHAVETSKGNFIIIHQLKRKKEEEELWEIEKGMMWEVSEVSGDGKTILRRFIPKNEEQKLRLSYYSFHVSSFDYSVHLAVDSFDRVFLADHRNSRVILFDSKLQWNGILIPTEEDEKEGRAIWRPKRLFYDEEKKELIVGGIKEVFVYTLNRK